MKRHAAAVVAAVTGASLLGGCGSRVDATDTNGLDGSAPKARVGDDATDDGSAASDASATNEDAPTFVMAPPLMLSTPTHRRMAAGAGETCAVSDQSNVTCWGDNLGIHESHVALEGALFDLAIGYSAGLSEPVCGVTASGAVSCADWVGGGPTPDTSALVDCVPQANVADIHLDRAVGVSGYFAFVDRSGQAGILLPNTCASFNPPGGLTALRRLGVSDGHACAIGAHSAAVCWMVRGYDGGPGGLEPTLADSYVDIVESFNAACAVTIRGTVRCWDSTGTEETSNFGFAHSVSSLSKRVVQLATDGVGRNLCGLFADGSVACSGDFEIGPLTISPVPDGEALVEIAVGTIQVCGIRPDDTVFCGGYGCSSGCDTKFAPPVGFKTIAAP